MKKLNVVKRNGDWFITGLQGPDIEIGDVRSYKEMHRALYDLWQTSDALEGEDKRHGDDGLLFHTPFGDFATYSYEVIPVEDAARIANKMLKSQAAAEREIEAEFMENEGFGKARMKEITDRYGHRFEDWPKDLVRKYWDASEKAIDETRAFFKRCGRQ